MALTDSHKGKRFNNLPMLKKREAKATRKKGSKSNQKKGKQKQPGML
jgi:hypothetical protein